MAFLKRYFPPALLMLPVIFLCGKLLLTPVKETRRVQDAAVERGWPWVYSEVFNPGAKPQISIFYWRPLAFDLAVLLAAATVCLGLLAWHKYLRGGWLLLSMRDIFAITTLFGGGFGWWMNVDYQWQQEQQAIGRLDKSILVLGRTYCEPQWLRRIWRHDDLQMFDRVSWVRVGQDPSKLDDVAITSLRKLNHLRVLEICDCPIFDEGLLTVKDLTDLECLDASGTKVTDAGVARLTALTGLKRLNLAGTAITDSAIDTIVRMQSLTDLDLSFCASVSDRGVGRLLELPHLTRALVPDMPQISEKVYRSLKNRLFERLLADG